MRSAVIVDAVRTAGGKRNGALSGWHPADLAAEVLAALVRRTGLDPALVDDVIMGCVTQIGYQGGNIGRWAALSAGFPESVPATTIDRQCGSSQQAAHFAAQAVLSGTSDIVIAAGVEVMSSTPMGGAIGDGKLPFGRRVEERYAGTEHGLPAQGISAELICAEWGLTRYEIDEYSAESHRRAARARDEGRFANEIVPVASRRLGDTAETGDLVQADEGIRPGTTPEILAKLRPAFTADGLITAGNSSQITDGASAMLVMSEDRADALGLTPRARFHTLTVTGSDPVLMLTGPIPATERALARSGLGIDDIDVFEVNEAFAPVVLAWARELHPDPRRVNPNGGAIALGHPLGATGVKLMATLIGELERTGGRYGLQTMCEGGGMANATIVERLG
ncbi:thiolase family protein [Actinomadura sp. B10D3]|uniref:thiolase family protein n=1 Tax=Actinomadura sp. B10D3 TaxID=3153557 RepID=UPI00325E25C2